MEPINKLNPNLKLIIKAAKSDIKIEKTKVNAKIANWSLKKLLLKENKSTKMFLRNDLFSGGIRVPCPDFSETS